MENKNISKTKIFIGNLILDIKDVVSKPLLWKLLIGAFAAYLVSEFFKGKNSQIHTLKDITEKVISSNYKLKIHIKSYDPIKNRFSLMLFPAGIFSHFFRAKDPPIFETSLAYCHQFSDDGNKFIQNLIQKRSPMTFSIESVIGSNIQGWIHYGRIKKKNLSEIMLRKGMCDMFAGDLTELSEENLIKVDEMWTNEMYAKLKAQGKWKQYAKKSSKTTKAQSWLKYKLDNYMLKNKRWVRRLLS